MRDSANDPPDLFNALSIRGGSGAVCMHFNLSLCVLIMMMLFIGSLQNDEKMDFWFICWLFY